MKTHSLLLLSQLLGTTFIPTAEGQTREEASPAAMYSSYVSDLVETTFQQGLYGYDVPEKYKGKRIQIPQDGIDGLVSTTVYFDEDTRDTPRVEIRFESGTCTYSITDSNGDFRFRKPEDSFTIIRTDGDQECLYAGPGAQYLLTLAGHSRRPINKKYFRRRRVTEGIIQDNIARLLDLKPQEKIEGEEITPPK